MREEDVEDAEEADEDGNADCCLCMLAQVMLQRERVLTSMAKFRR